MGRRRPTSRSASSWPSGEYLFLVSLTVISSCSGLEAFGKTGSVHLTSLLWLEVADIGPRNFSDECRWEDHWYVVYRVPSQRNGSLTGLAVVPILLLWQ